MNEKTLLIVLITGLVVLTGSPPRAEALSVIDHNFVSAPAEKIAATVSSQRRHAPYRHWRHRGGRHPFYGSRF
jgi:hypothetical protein